MGNVPVPNPGPEGGTPPNPQPKPMVKVVLLPNVETPADMPFGMSIDIPCYSDEQVVEIMRECRDSIEAIRRKYHP